MLPYIIIGIVVLLLGGLVFMLIYTNKIAQAVYDDQLVKTSPEKWLRVCSAPDNEDQVDMWDTGCRWGEENAGCMEEVHIVHDGLNLYGEFYHFGGDRCVIILPGRCECLKYSYYFAEPYKQAGMNVLVIDQRAHGKSDGKYNTIGVKEHTDLLEWVRYIGKQYGIREVWFHGICIGSASAILAVTEADCPDIVKGIVLEGCFVSFRETFKQHMIYIKRPVIPVCDEVMLKIKHQAGGDVYRYAPIRYIGQVKVPILFLFGKEDVFSIPEKSQLLYDTCGSEKKELVWFEQGPHSHLRQYNMEKYDQAIIDFTSKYIEQGS